MKRYGVRPSVHPSVPLPARAHSSKPAAAYLANPLLQVSCCGPSGQEISIDCCTASARQQMRAVPLCQPTKEAEHRLVVQAFGVDVQSLSELACRAGMVTLYSPGEFEGIYIGILYFCAKRSRDIKTLF